MVGQSTSYESGKMYEVGEAEMKADQQCDDKVAEMQEMQRCYIPIFSDSHIVTMYRIKYCKYFEYLNY